MKKVIHISSIVEQHHAILKNWTSELEFYTIETSFLHRLLDENFIQLCGAITVEALKLNGERLLKLEKEEARMSGQLTRQARELEWITKNLIQENPRRITEFQHQIAREMVCINVEFRALKKNIFGIVEQLKDKNSLLVNT
jgi:proline dehydrogenase